jgi:hypothetical protein
VQAQAIDGTKASKRYTQRERERERERDGQQATGSVTPMTCKEGKRYTTTNTTNKTRNVADEYKPTSAQPLTTDAGSMPGGGIQRNRLGAFQLFPTFSNFHSWSQPNSSGNSTGATAPTALACCLCFFLLLLVASLLLFLYSPPLALLCFATPRSLRSPTMAQASLVCLVVLGLVCHFALGTFVGTSSCFVSRSQHQHQHQLPNINFYYCSLLSLLQQQ